METGRGRPKTRALNLPQIISLLRRCGLLTFIKVCDDMREQLRRRGEGGAAHGVTWAPKAADSHVTKGQQQGGRTDAHKSYEISTADPFRSVGALAAMQLPLVGGA